MKKTLMLLAASLLLIPGCATMMTGLTSEDYRDAPLVLAYSDPEVIRDQDKVATLVLGGTYGLVLDGMPVREAEGRFNPDLRVSGSGATVPYIVDILPGTHTLRVTYDALKPGGKTPVMTPSARMGSSTTVSGSYSGPLPVSWDRTSDSTHTLKAGEVYAVGLKLMTITGAIDLYPLDEKQRRTVIETRNRAAF